MNGKNGKFIKTVFFFPRVDTINSAKEKIGEKPTNDGKGMGLK